MKHSFSETGNLIITVDDEEKAQLVEAGDDIHLDTFMHDFLEPITCNSDVDWVRPEEIGALTSAPILGIVSRNDDGEIEETHNIWWYPNYAVTSVCEDLLEYGQAVFFKAEESK